MSRQKTKSDRDILLDFLPESGFHLYSQWRIKYPHQLVITRPRRTKLGDYRPPRGKRSFHKITVNGNLNQYEFLVTLIHEVAHLVTHLKYERSVSPHGPEWKENYSALLRSAITSNCFPERVLPQLNKHCNQPSASSCVDVELYKALRQFSEGKEDIFLVEEVEQGTKFILRGGKRFIKGPLLRKRFKCEEIGTGKIYLVSPIAEMKILN